MNPIGRRLTFDHLVIATTDVQAICKFWQRVLFARANGLEEWQNGAIEYPHLELGTWRVNVHEVERRVQPGARRIVSGSQNLCVAWPGTIASAREHLKRCEVPIILGPIEQSGASGEGTSVYFRDPDGNLLEFICYENCHDGVPAETRSD